jgi:multidrug efflux pump subunit AcrA (membrane-fusion protein)
MRSVIFIPLISLCVFSIGCQKIESGKTQNQQAIAVKVMAVKLQNIAKTLNYAGNIKAQDEAIIYPKVSGKIIEKVKENGASVAKGEAIAFIDRDEVGLTFEKAPVESPLAGIIGRTYVDRGQNVTMQTPIALVINMDKVKISLDIPEKYLSQLSLGQQAKIYLDGYAGKEFAGAVSRISPVLDLDTRSAPIEITVDNAEHLLKSGMFAKVKLILEEHKQVPAILKEALIGREPDIFVYVTENNKAVMRKVFLGIHQGPYWEVKEGLKENDKVVIVGQQRLYDNALVTLEE